MDQRLPKGSLVLVTGANGYLGSHICDQVLQAGYKVRGTVRDVTKSAWLDEYFTSEHGPGRFELVAVTDITQPNAFDHVIKGISAFAFVASDMSMNPDPKISVTPVVNAIQTALAAASKEPSCKSFVLTSSCVAAVTAQPNTHYHIDTGMFNETAVHQAFREPFESTAARRWAVYGASKCLTEQAAWTYVKNNQPHYTFNSIVPNANFGPFIDPTHQEGSAAGWIRAMYVPTILGQVLSSVKPQWFVHTQDTARLHVACLTDLSLSNERLFAFSEPFHWSQILDILRKLTPDKDLPANLDGDEFAGVVGDRDLSTVANERALEVLKSYYNQDQWLSLEKGLEDVVASIF